MLSGPSEAVDAVLEVVKTELRRLGGRRRRGAGATLEEQALDFIGSLIDKWSSLEQAAREGANLHGYLIRSLRNWIADAQRDQDPQWHAAARRLSSSIEAQQAAGVCQVIAAEGGWDGALVRLVEVRVGRSLCTVRDCEAVIDAFSEANALRSEFRDSKGHRETQTTAAFWRHLVASHVVEFGVSEMLKALHGDSRRVALDAAPAPMDPAVDVGANLHFEEWVEKGHRLIAAAQLSEARKWMIEEAFRICVEQRGQCDFAEVFASLGAGDRRRRSELKMLLQSILRPISLPANQGLADNDGEGPSSPGRNP